MRNRFIFFGIIAGGVTAAALLFVFFVLPVLKPTSAPGGLQNQTLVTPSRGQLPGTLPGGARNTNQGAGGQLPNVNTVGGPQTPPLPSLDSVARGGDTIARTVVTENASFPATGSGGLSYYNRADQSFYRLLSNGSTTKLSSEFFPAVRKVTWSDDANRAILTFPDDRSLYVDFSKNRKVVLPVEGRDFVFQGSSDHLVYALETGSEEKDYIVVSDLEGSNAQGVEHLGGKRSQVQTTFSPGGDVIAFYRKPTGATSEEIFFIGQHGENFRSMNVAGFHFRAAWLPDGRLLYSIVTPEANYNPTLWVTDAKGDSIGLNNRSLNLPTDVDHCVFASGSPMVYCAVPDSLPEGMGLDPEAFGNVPRNVYAVNVDTGLARFLATPVREDGTGGFSIGQLALSQDQSELYFTDAANGSVLKIKLK